MKKIVLLLAIGFLSLTAFSQDESNSIMIKSIETYGSFANMKSSLHIINENGEVVSTELDKHNTKGIPANMASIKTALDKYLNKGYELISSNAVSFGSSGVYAIEHTYMLKIIKQKETEN